MARPRVIQNGRLRYGWSPTALQTLGRGEGLTAPSSALNILLVVFMVFLLARLDGLVVVHHSLEELAC